MFQTFTERSYKLERLDTGDYTPQEYELWQKEMKLINRFLGDMRALRLSLLSEIKEEKFSVLDVGAGSGELLRLIEGWAKKNDKSTRLVGVEINENGARAITGKKTTSVCGDALLLPFADASFDYVICSLFTHHLTNPQVVRLLKEMNRVARKKIFVIDLNRHPLAYYLYKIFSAIFLQRFTQEDGALSILRSFRPEELKILAIEANLKNVKVERRAMFRLVLSSEK